jgi:hypothetical protein
VASILSIGVDPAIQARIRSLLDPKQVRQAEFQAVKRTTGKLVTIVKNKVKEQSFVKPKYIGRVISKRDPRGDPPVGEVIVRKQRLPLVAFKISVSKRSGVRVSLSKNLPPIVLRHAFVATVKAPANNGEVSEHTGVFLRSRHLPSKGPNQGKGKLTARGFAGRLAIKQVFGKSIFAYVNVPEIRDEIVFDGRAEMRKQLENQIKRFTQTAFSFDATT